MFFSQDTMKTLTQSEKESIGTEIYRWNDHGELSMHIHYGYVNNPGLDNNESLNKSDKSKAFYPTVSLWNAYDENISYRRKMFFNGRKRVYKNSEILDKFSNNIDGNLITIRDNGNGNKDISIDVNKNVIELSEKEEACQSYYSSDYSMYILVNQKYFYAALLLNNYLRSYLSVIVQHAHTDVYRINNVVLKGDCNNYTLDKRYSNTNNALEYRGKSYRKTAVLGFEYEGVSIEYSITPFAVHSDEYGLMVDVKMFNGISEQDEVENIFFKDISTKNPGSISMRDLYAPLHHFVQEIS